MDVIPFGISPVALTTVVTALGAPAVTHFVGHMIPEINIPYQGEIMMAGAIVGILFGLKGLKGWFRIIALILCGVLFSVGLLRSQFLGGLTLGGEV